jgi:hypothetical protein
MENVTTLAAVGFTALAAVLGVRAATVDVRDNMDKFMEDLQRQGRWASWAAVANAAAAAVLIVQTFVR